MYSINKNELNTLELKNQKFFYEDENKKSFSEYVVYLVSLLILFFKSVGDKIDAVVGNNVEVKKEVAIFPTETVFIYDRSLEDSLFAAAFVKLMSSYVVIEYNWFNKFNYTPNCQVIWLGFTPPKKVMSKIRCKQTILSSSHEHEIPNFSAANIWDHYNSTVAKVIKEVSFFQLLPEHTVSHWLGLAFHVNRFKMKSNNEVSLATAYFNIKRAYNLLHTSGEWDQEYTENGSISTCVEQYREEFSQAIKLLNSNTTRSVALKLGRLVTVFHLDISGPNWYLLRRLIMKHQQNWETMRVIDREIYMDNN